MSKPAPQHGSGGASPYPVWERIVVAFAAVSAFALAFAHLGTPSLWHDELIHVYVGKTILETGKPLLLGGHIFTNGTLFNYLLAGVIAIFGDGEVAVRSLSVAFGVVNIVLTYRLMRPLVGGPAAALTALLMAWSPWQLAWARQARFYMLHQTVYLVTMFAVWRFGTAAPFQRVNVRRCEGAKGGAGNRTGLQNCEGLSARTTVVVWGCAIVALYLVGLLAGPQTIFFLGPIGAYAICRWLGERRVWSRWTALIVICGVLGSGTLLGYYLLLPKAEHDALFKEALRTSVPDDVMIDYDQSDSLYYFRFYANNLSTGFFVLACTGLVLLVARGGKQGLFVALAFVAPILILNYGIPQDRRYRFLFFAYPFYVGACAYAAVYLAQFVRHARRSWWRMAVAVVVLAFSARLAVSEYKLAVDCLDVAAGGNSTLAVHHPQWRQPCAYVKERLDGAVVVCTTYITARYYVGQVDNWYPSRVIVWEEIESGLPGMKTLDELKAYVAAHPRGFFIAEHRRFHMWPFFTDDLAWVESHMKRIDEASNSDITLYAWGMD